MSFSIRISGIRETIRRLNNQIGDEAIRDIDRITETYARKMAEESAAMAPIDSGALRGSIASSPHVSSDIHMWEYGSNLPYAVRQEYEHTTNKAFIRKVVWNNRAKYRKAVLKRITEG